MKSGYPASIFSHAPSWVRPSDKPQLGHVLRLHAWGVFFDKLLIFKFCMEFCMQMGGYGFAIGNMHIFRGKLHITMEKERKISKNIKIRIFR